MTNSTRITVALVLIFAAIVAVAVGGNKFNSPSDAAALPLAAVPGKESPVRATKGDRIHVGAEIRKIAGVTIVMRDFGPTIR